MQRQSRKREAILECLRSTHSHPSADEIYGKLKLVYPDLSLATVYRNLGDLKAAGVIGSLGKVKGEERFDGDTRTHPHAICRLCGAVADLPAKNIPGSALSVLTGHMADVSGFALSQGELCFLGVCPACQTQEPSSHECETIHKTILL